MRYAISVLLLCIAVIYQSKAQSNRIQHPLSLEEAYTILLNNNNPIKIAQKGIETAIAEKQQLNSTWYPIISGTGLYSHSSNDIEVKLNIGDAAQDLIHNIPDLELLLSQLLPQLQEAISSLNNLNISVPILKNNITSFDIVAVWPLITGGKRIFASRIGKDIEEIAKNFNTLTINAQTALMLNAYYTLKLSDEIVAMQQEHLRFTEKLHYNASRLKEEGFLTKAEYLVAKIAQDEAANTLQTSQHNRNIAENALNTILGKKIEFSHLSGNFFILDTLPNIIEINTQILQNNAQLKILNAQSNILENKTKIAKTDYLPTVAAFAKQNIYSNNIPKNLVPNTIIGATMQWNIFNGFAREKEIKKSKIQEEQLVHTTDQTRKEILTGALALRNSMVDALHNIETLSLTVDLAKELLREREKAFAEGMCTTTDILFAQSSLTKAKTAQALAYWQYCTSLANLLALSSQTEKFIQLHHGYKSAH